MSEIHPNQAELRKSWLYFCTVMLIAFLCYLPSLNHSYSLDDEFITHNEYVSEGLTGLDEIFTRGYYAGYNGAEDLAWRPVTLAFFAVERSLSTNPGFHHAVNAVLYALLCGLLFILFRKLFDRKEGLFAFGAVLIFAIHPVHVEVVASIKNREEILALIFVTLSFFFLFRYFRSRKALDFVLSAIMLFIGMLSKETAFAFVFAVPALIWFYDFRGWRSLVIKSTLFISAGVIYLFHRGAVLDSVFIEREIQPIHNPLALTEGFLEYSATLMAMFGRYLELIFFPLELHWNYGFSEIPVYSWGDSYPWISLGIWTFILIYAWYAFWNRRKIALGIILFALPLLLVGNVFFMMGASVAERFLFAPSVGFCIVLPILFEGLWKSFIPNRKKAGTDIWYVLIGVVCIFYLFKVQQRIPVWENKLSLFSSEEISEINSAQAAYALSNEHLIHADTLEDQKISERNWKKALKAAERSIEILPDYGPAWYTLGVSLMRLGDTENAFNSFYRSVELNPRIKESWNYMGAIAMQVGNMDRAENFLRNAIALDSCYAKAFTNLGTLHALNENFAASVDLFERALQCDPGNEEASRNLEKSRQALGQESKPGQRDSLGINR